jgi:hypothetical protein
LKQEYSVYNYFTILYSLTQDFSNQKDLRKCMYESLPTRTHTAVITVSDCQCAITMTVLTTKTWTCTCTLYMYESAYLAHVILFLLLFRIVLY